MNEGLREVARLMARAQRVTVLTGAGISAESGIPTFRGAGGFWKDEAEMMRLATMPAIWTITNSRPRTSSSTRPERSLCSEALSRLATKNFPG